MHSTGPAKIGGSVEQAYSETSKYWGSTYVRYSSLDGKHKHIASPKGVFAVHCEEQSMTKQ